MQIVPSTPQTNSSDCGVFAVAYTAELMGADFIALQAPFDVAQMRSHLEQCLEVGS